ncbi:Bromodomain protein [Metarhizium guizhouense ARSEF 977]|uniref:Bromodomain protein n=1 Tax=Metarhizium guizhouense (strain ARSEF 977) TaxID=1276136 RepID=A0A0B4GCJ7_METGA|nr:Bromodomain protein [Metarhizium guizhouense ARSEF 977]
MTDSKRKANGHSATEADDRSAKRRKLAEFDLSKGESRESTTAYGLAFLEQIRRTADKSGRLVATYFENLLPREGNAEYYKRTRMPICLTSIEEKLNKGGFKNLAELESYFKRMIANAKEFYPRSSTVFEDAERVRKALSNYMTKTNPAYQTRNYQAVPTPLPPEDGEEVEEEEEEGDEDAEGEDEPAQEQEDEDGEEEEEEEEEAEGEGDEGDDEEPASRRRSIILKRSRGRPSRDLTSHTNSPRRARPAGRPDQEYKNVPFKGLNFQQAQEKIVEELLRYKEPEYEGYFEPFVNLPPRALRDYYRVISDPLSLKKLQKEVLGIQGRGDPTGISDFKSWNALAERAKLLWNNAYFYNEEGSEIYELAQELEKAFNEQLKKAKAVVQEPAQPKIKLKVGQSIDTPSSSKKITILVGGRGSSVDSPTPQTAQSIEPPAGGSHVNGTARQPALDAARSASASMPSPSPSTHIGLKAEESARMSPAVLAQIPAEAPPGPPTPAVEAPPPPPPPPPPGPPQIQSTNPMANGYVEPKRLRAPGKGIKDALISRLRIQLHPSMQPGDPVLLDVLPLPHEMQQSGTVNVPPIINRIFIVPMLPDLLQDRQYSLWVLIDKQPLKPCHQPIPNQLPQERAFDVMLHPGVNVIEAHLIAAIPRHERVPGGPEVELEVFTAYVNVLRN